MIVIAQKPIRKRLRVVRKAEIVEVELNAALAWELDFKGVDYVGM